MLHESTPNPVPLRPRQTLLQRIRERGVIRIGYNPDKLPFAYFNIRGDLVGYDINLAHYLAGDLGVRAEFVPFTRDGLAEQLQNDHFDVVMSGLVGTLDRAETMMHTKPYLDVTLAFVVQDYRVREFAEFERLQNATDLRIGYVGLSKGFLQRLRAAWPRAEFIELPNNRTYFQGTYRELDALLISAESGSAYTLFYPEFEVVVPARPRMSMPLFYAIGAEDAEMRDFLEHWVELRKMDGTSRQLYDHWVLGKSHENEKPRWSIIRNVLGWVR